MCYQHGGIAEVVEHLTMGSMPYTRKKRKGSVALYLAHNFPQPSRPDFQGPDNCHLSDSCTHQKLPMSTSSQLCLQGS
jgi:hypothetical protein